MWCKQVCWCWHSVLMICFDICLARRHLCTAFAGALLHIATIGVSGNRDLCAFLPHEVVHSLWFWWCTCRCGMNNTEIAEPDFLALPRCCSSPWHEHCTEGRDRQRCSLGYIRSGGREARPSKWFLTWEVLELYLVYQDGSSLPPRKSGTKPLISARFASWCSQLANFFPFSGMCLPPALSSLRGWKIVLWWLF